MNTNYLQKMSKLSLVFFLMLSVNLINAQSIPPTNGGSTGTNVVPPGWTPIVGSTDIVSETVPNFGNWNCVVPPANPLGHDDWMSGISGLSNETVQTTISGLTPGQEYSFLGYVGNFHGDNSFWGFPAVVTFNGTVNLTLNGAVVSTNVFSSGGCEWQLATFTFTATSSTATLSPAGTPTDNSYFWWHISIAANAVTPVVPCGAGTDAPSFN